MITALADLRHAALHEVGHLHVATLVGVRGSIVLRATPAGAEGAFRFAGDQVLTQAVRERVAVAGAIATALREHPEITVAELVQRLKLLSGGVSSSDSALCNGQVSMAAVSDVLLWLRRDWDQVEELARRELQRLGVSW